MNSNFITSFKYLPCLQWENTYTIYKEHDLCHHLFIRSTEEHTFEKMCTMHGAKQVTPGYGQTRIHKYIIRTKLRELNVGNLRHSNHFEGSKFFQSMLLIVIHEWVLYNLSLSGQILHILWPYFFQSIRAFLRPLSSLLNNSQIFRCPANSINIKIKLAHLAPLPRTNNERKSSTQSIVPSHVSHLR